MFSLLSVAQVWEDDLLKEMPNANFKEKSEAFEKFRSQNSYTKGNGYKPYAREIDFLSSRMPKNGIFPKTALYKEWLKQKNRIVKTASNSNWIPLGPFDVPIILSNGKRRGNGRVNAIAFDPVNPEIIYVGAPAGGFWKSIDGGSNWITYTDDLPVIGVSSIAVDPLNPQIIYIATGDANASDTYSIGVLKSVDGGVTWSTTGLSYNVVDGERVNKVIINPNYTDSLYAATNSNIMLSTDAGQNWNSIGIPGRWRDIEFKPGNPSILYAAKQSSGGSNVYRTVDGGANWVIINNGVASTGKYRPLIAVTPANPEIIYALYSASDYSFHGLYKSSDGGNSWALQSNSPNILGRDTDGTSTGGQAWYDLSLGLSTSNEDHLYVGGINLWETVDGGVTWTIEASSGNGSNYSYMHVDQHCLEFNPINNIAYAGNDGGLYKYMNSLNKWVDISDGLEISQFYKLGLSSSNPDRLIAGAQDNGTEMLTNGIWDAVRGADGMECAIDSFDEDLLYSTSQYGGLRKSYNGGNTWDNIKPVPYDGAWVTPYKIHPQNNNMIVIGYDEVYKSMTAGAIWDSISYNVSGGQALRTIALAPSDENYIYAAAYTSLKVTKDGGNTWINIKPGLPNYNISDIVISANNPEKLWVTFSQYSANNKVFLSIDGGMSWVNVTGSGLPNLPVNCIVNQHQTNDALYVGTDVGVYYKDANTATWAPFMNGLPNVIVSELEIHYGTGKIRAATFGRGVWESNLQTVPNNINTEQSYDINTYPNPASEYFYIQQKSSGWVKELKIFSISGKLVFQKQINGNNNSLINIESLSKGCYILELIGDRNCLRKKLLKN